MSELTGTMECPICGKNTPHEHTGLEMGEYRQYEMQRAAKQLKFEAEQAKRRKQRLGVVESAYKDELQGVHKKYGRLLVDACDFCRGLPRGNEELKNNCDWLYGITIDRKRNAASCPECNRVLAEWE